MTRTYYQQNTINNFLLIAADGFISQMALTQGAKVRHSQ